VGRNMWEKRRVRGCVVGFEESADGKWSWAGKAEAERFGRGAACRGAEQVSPALGRGANDAGPAASFECEKQARLSAARCVLVVFSLLKMSLNYLHVR